MVTLVVSQLRQALRPTDRGRPIDCSLVNVDGWDPANRGRRGDTLTRQCTNHNGIHQATLAIKSTHSDLHICQHPSHDANAHQPHRSANHGGPQHRRPHHTITRSSPISVNIPRPYQVHHTNHQHQSHRQVHTIPAIGWVSTSVHPDTKP